MSNELNCNCGILFTELMDGRTDGFVPVKYRYGIAASVLYRWSGLRAQHSTPRSFGGNLMGFQSTDLPELSMPELSTNASGSLWCCSKVGEATKDGVTKLLTACLQCSLLVYWARAGCSLVGDCRRLVVGALATAGHDGLGTPWW
jgi:hypothetical protein